MNRLRLIRLLGLMTFAAIVVCAATWADITIRHRIGHWIFSQDERPAPAMRLDATAINDRRVGSICCHGAIVPLAPVMLVG